MDADENSALIGGNPRGDFRPAAQASLNPLVNINVFLLKML
jgi:hypothetical protein